MRRRNWLVLVAVVGLATACSRESWQRLPGPDDLVALVPWFANMRKDIAIHPYKGVPRPPVAGTVPLGGGDVTISQAELVPGNAANLARRFPNSVPRTAESIDRGRERYEIYCTVCHGRAGDAVGPMQQAMPFIPSLVADRARALNDAQIYGIIVAGRGLMPTYIEKVRGDDRWHIVNYIRVLQGTN